MPEKNNLFLGAGSSAVFDKKAFPARPQIEGFAKVGRRADILVRSNIVVTSGSTKSSHTAMRQPLRTRMSARRTVGVAQAKPRREAPLMIVFRVKEWNVSLSFRLAALRPRYPFGIEVRAPMHLWSYLSHAACQPAGRAT